MATRYMKGLIGDDKQYVFTMYREDFVPGTVFLTASKGAFVGQPKPRYQADGIYFHITLNDNWRDIRLFTQYLTKNSEVHAAPSESTRSQYEIMWEYFPEARLYCTLVSGMKYMTTEKWYKVMREFSGDLANLCHKFTGRSRKESNKRYWTPLQDVEI
jgi:hypothetical protein